MIKTLITAALFAMTATTANADIIGKVDAKTLGTKVMTPEALWAMGRISASAPSLTANGLSIKWATIP